jgi:hypothetical protein
LENTVYALAAFIARIFAKSCISTAELSLGDVHQTGRLESLQERHMFGSLHKPHNSRRMVMMFRYCNSFSL